MSASKGKTAPASKAAPAIPTLDLSPAISPNALRCNPSINRC